MDAARRQGSRLLDRCSVDAGLAPDPWQQRGYGGGHQSKPGCYRRHFDHGDRRTIREQPVHLGKSRAQEILHEDADPGAVPASAGTVAIAPACAYGSESPCAIVMNEPGRNSTSGVT